MNFIQLLLRFLPLLVMAIMTLGTYWLVQLNTPDSNEEKIKRHIPDYIIDGMVVTTIGPQGEAKYRIIGKKLIHYEDDASSEIFSPIARAFKEGKPPITVTAKMGYLNGDMSILDLVGNALLTRPAQAATTTQTGSARLLMNSEKFKIFLNDDVIKTNLPVVLEQGQSVMTSQEGAIFDNVTQKLTMVGQVRGRLESENK